MPHRAVTREILRYHRLLEPVDVLVRHRAPKRDRLHGIEAMIGVQHQARFRADLATHRANQRDVSINIEADLQLDGVKTLLDVARNFIDDIFKRVALINAIGAGGIRAHGLAQRAAEQPVHGHAEVLALQIP